MVSVVMIAIKIQIKCLLNDVFQTSAVFEKTEDNLFQYFAAPTHFYLGIRVALSPTLILGAKFLSHVSCFKVAKLFLSAVCRALNPSVTMSLQI